MRGVHCDSRKPFAFMSCQHEVDALVEQLRELTRYTESPPSEVDMALADRLRLLSDAENMWELAI